MAIMYFSDKTKRYYKTEEEATKAEFEAKKAENLEKIRKEREEAEKKAKEEERANERKTRAAEVEEARKEMVAARSKYSKLLEEFCAKFGTYHLSLTGDDAKKSAPTLFDIFDGLLF